MLIAQRGPCVVITAAASARPQLSHSSRRSGHAAACAAIALRGTRALHTARSFSGSALPQGTSCAGHTVARCEARVSCAPCHAHAKPGAPPACKQGTMRLGQDELACCAKSAAATALPQAVHCCISNKALSTTQEAAKKWRASAAAATSAPACVPPSRRVSACAWGAAAVAASASVLGYAERASLRRRILRLARRQPACRCARCGRDVRARGTRGGKGSRPRRLRRRRCASRAEIIGRSAGEGYRIGSRGERRRCRVSNRCAAAARAPAPGCGAAGVQECVTPEN